MAALTTLALTASTVLAQDKFSDGAITWDTSSTVWGTVSGGPYTSTWSNGDNATFEGTAGTVTLGEAITAANMTFTTDGYTIDANGNALTLADSGTITADANNIIIDADLGGSNLKWNLDGTGSATWTGNKDGGNFNKNGSGTWTLEGLVDGRVCNINAGHLKVTGTLVDSYRYISVNNGATLHYNSSGAIDSRSGTSTSWRWQLQGGAFLDNTSGAAITTSDHDPSQWWKGDWTFLGSNGANSDLYLGTGEVGLTGSRTVTVSNASATLSVGGVIADYGNNYGVTKDGPGTLVLSAVNAYTGTTTVSAGTLSLGDGTDNSNLADASVLEIATGAVLNANWSAGNIDDIFLLTFDGVPQAAGTWGPLGSTADFPDARITGTGIINNAGGVYTDGTFFWDGLNTGGTGDGASDGGLGTWSTSTDNWDKGLVAREVWTNDTGNKAIFSGPSGDVTLGTDITLGELIIDSAAADGYLITGNTLNFGGVNAITVESQATIESAITGSPTVGNGTGTLTVAPTGGSMKLGAVSGGGTIKLGGTTTGNEVASATGTRIRLDSSGTWTLLGDASAYQHYLDNGTLIVEGLIKCNNRTLQITPGVTLVVNGSMETAHGSHPFSWAAGGGTLKGTGVMKDDLIPVPVGGTIAPGYPTGTLTIDNNGCTIAGTLAITVDGAACSTLAVDGHLDLSSGADIIDVTELGAATLGTYTIATYTTLTGTFDTETLPAGYSVDYGTAGEIRLTVGGGPGPVASFDISAIASPQVQGTPITGITITAKDASDAVVTGFTGTVDFSGTGGFTGTSASFVSGVASGVSVTPTNAGDNLTLVVTDSGGPSTGSTTITTIQSLFEDWAGAGPDNGFGDDKNGDGVDNGIAFLLGAADPNADATGLLPTVSESGGALTLTFDMLKAANRGSAALAVEHSTDLGDLDAWLGATVPTPANDVTFVVTPGGGTTDNVVATIAAAAAGGGDKLFGRLEATE